MTISNWEKEKNKPNQKHFEELMKIFQLPAEYFYQENRLLLPYSQLSAFNIKKRLSAILRAYLSNKKK